MGKRTLVHITKDLDNRYKWTGKNAECCIMAVHTNGYVTDDNLKQFIKDKIITNEEYVAIDYFDMCIAREPQMKIIEQLAQRLKLKIVLHEVKADKITGPSSRSET